MNQFLAQGSSLALFSVVAFALLAGSRARGEEPLDIGVLAQQLVDWQSSFATLRVQWELFDVPKGTGKTLPDWSEASNPSSVQRRTEGEWSWSDRGLIRLDRWTPSKDAATERSVVLLNGPKGIVHTAEYERTAEGSERLVNLKQRPAGSDASRFPLEQIGGIAIPGFSDWPPDFTSDWRWTFQRREEIDGAPCARIVGIFAARKDFDRMETLWIDLEHNGLVRRRQSAGYPGSERRRGIDSIVDEFQQLEDGRWFPRRGRIRIATPPFEGQLWNIAHVSIDEPLSPELFEPPQPEADTVVEGATLATNSAQQSDKAPDEEVATAPQTEKPTSMADWIPILAGGSIALTVIAFWSSRRRAPRRN